MPLGTKTTASSALPIQFEVPLLNPSPQGLFAATNWTESDGASRFLMAGVDFRVHNFGGDAAFGVWGANWCAAPDDLAPEDVKDGARPTFLDTFDPMTVWAYDECDLTPASQAEVRARVSQNLLLREQVAVEREFADRLVTDALAQTTPIATATGIIAAVGALEAKLAVAGVLGVIHASAGLATAAAAQNLVRYNGAKLTTPLGHQWVFGGGYVDGLGARLIATSPTYGWRDPARVLDTKKLEHNLYVAVAERSLVVGYEATIGAVEVVPSAGGGDSGGTYPSADTFPGEGG